MLFQLRWSKESAFTCRANVAKFLRVSFHVIVEVVASRESFVTFLALVWLFFGMCKKMTFQFVLPVKCAGTASVATEWTRENWTICIRNVDQLVPLELILARERLPTLFTHVFLDKSMYRPLMCSAVCDRSERLTAKITAKVSFHYMYCFVSFKVDLRVKHLAALITCVYVRLGRPVVVQRFWGIISLTTITALKMFLVQARMFPSFIFRAKFCRTFGTLVCPLGIGQIYWHKYARRFLFSRTFCSDCLGNAAFTTKVYKL